MHRSANDCGNRLHAPLGICLSPGHQIGKRDARKKFKNNLVEILPKVMRQTRCAAAAGAFPSALRRVHSFVDRLNDPIDRNRRRIACKPIASPGPSRAFHQPGAPEPAKNLLEIRHRDLLAFSDLRKRHRLIAISSMKRHVEHGGYGKSSFGGELHSGLPSFLTEKVRIERVGSYPHIPDLSSRNFGFSRRDLNRQEKTQSGKTPGLL